MVKEIKYLSDIPSRYTREDYLDDQKNLKADERVKQINAWLRENPEVGPLNSGKFYYHDAEHKYHDIKAFGEVPVAARCPIMRGGK